MNFFVGGLSQDTEGLEVSLLPSDVPFQDIIEEHLVYDDIEWKRVLQVQCGNHTEMVSRLLLF